MKRTDRSFIKNGKERKERNVLLKRTDAQPCTQIQYDSRTPVREVEPGLHGIYTPERNDSLAESQGLYQYEYGEPRDHLAQTPCSLFSNLRLSRKLIEEHPHIELLSPGRDSRFKGLCNWPASRAISAAT